MCLLQNLMFSMQISDFWRENFHFSACSILIGGINILFMKLCFFLKRHWKRFDLVHFWCTLSRRQPLTKTWCKSLLGGKKGQKKRKLKKWKIAILHLTKTKESSKCIIRVNKCKRSNIYNLSTWDRFCRPPHRQKAKSKIRIAVVTIRHHALNHVPFTFVSYWWRLHSIESHYSH